MSSSSAFIGWFCVTCAFPCLQSGNLALQPAFASPRHDRGSCTRSVERPLCRSHPWHAQRGALLAPLLTSPHLLAYGFLGLLGEGACMIRLSVLQCTHNSG
jgi:hypothetical protein